MYSILRIERQQATGLEDVGSKPKFWFLHNDRKWLFKGEQRGTGEDWAEKIACHLCDLLGLPHVHYELADLYDADKFIWPGVVCETCATDPLSLVLGNQLLLERDPDYPADQARKYKVRQHTVAAVTQAVGRLGPPSSEWIGTSPIGLTAALDYFVGYILLDAWIANQDRHHQNWAALRGNDLRLAPTFDHGAALARNISDQERAERMSTKDRNRTISVFTAKATSAFYATAADSSALKTFDAFWAFAGGAPQAAKIWLDRLLNVDFRAIQAILSQVPDRRMSNISKEFTLQLLAINHARFQEEATRI